jgi:hypothetical protein
VKTDGSLWAWGDNRNGQLGTGKAGGDYGFDEGIDLDIPTEIISYGVKSCSSGYNHTLCIKTNGSLFAWGDNGAGKLGDGSGEDQPNPVLILDSLEPDDYSISYALVAGNGDTDNARFSIDGRKLQTAAPLDFEAKSTYSIRVRGSLPTGLTLAEQEFLISVTDVDESREASVSAFGLDEAPIQHRIGAFEYRPGKKIPVVQGYNTNTSVTVYTNTSVTLE